MNCATYRNDILLAASGELNSRRQAGLSVHLAACPDCHAFAETARVLSKSARENLPQDTPHASVMVAIRQAAEARGRGTVFGFPAHVVRVAAYAAVLALMAGSVWFAAVPRQPRASRIAALSTMVRMVAESTMDDESIMTIVDDERDLEAVARQLLEMEGFRVDELFDDEVLSLFEEPSPTTTQWHRIPASPAQRCV